MLNTGRRPCTSASGDAHVHVVFDELEVLGQDEDSPFLELVHVDEEDVVLEVLGQDDDSFFLELVHVDEEDVVLAILRTSFVMSCSGLGWRSLRSGGRFGASRHPRIKTMYAHVDVELA